MNYISNALHHPERSERTSVYSKNLEHASDKCSIQLKRFLMMLGMTLGLALVFWSGLTHAEEIFPADCTPLVVTGDLVELPAAKSVVTMIHNLSNADLWVTHPVAEPNASAGWSSHVQAGNWSALVLNNEKFELSCIESRPGHEQQVACSTVLAVCQFSATSLPEKASGTYWAAEDMQLSPLIAYIKRRGFVLSALPSKE